MSAISAQFVRGTGAWLEFQTPAVCWFCGRRNIGTSARFTYVDVEDKFLGKDMCRQCHHSFIEAAIREWEPLTKTDKLDIEPEELEVMKMVSACSLLRRKLIRESHKTKASA